MKKILLVLLVLGMGIAQSSSATETTYQSNHNLTHTITNSSPVSNYGSSQHTYSMKDGVYVSANDEISQAINKLNARAKQKDNELASLTSQQRSVRSDSLEDMKKWAEQGNAGYQIKVGFIYYEGRGVRQDLVLARRMFQKAAKQGYVQGQGMLGLFYESGLGGLKRNRSTAKEWYGKACDKGSQEGCNEYRRLNQRGF